MEQNDRIDIAGHMALVGSAIIRRLRGLGWKPKTQMEDELETVYEWYKKSVSHKLRIRNG